MSPKFWEYFLSIEADLSECSRYVEFTEENYKTYSNEFAKIIVTASSEIDAILKELSAIITPEANADNINKYFTVIYSEFPSFTDCAVDIRRHSLSLEPWSQWSKDKSPEWWGQGYNKIKHDRTNHFQKANLFNALNSVGALFLSILHYHHHVSAAQVTVDVNRGTKLFTPARPGGNKGGVFWYYGIPTPVENSGEN